MATRATPGFPPLCGLPGCHLLCYQENGKFLDYCRRTHADQARGGVGVGVGHQPGICQLDGCPQPVVFDAVKNRWHDFCSKRHADDNGQLICVGGGQGASTCRLPGCQKSVYRDPATGQGTGYCNRGHRARAMASAVGATAKRPHVDRAFNGGTTSATDFRLYELSKTHPVYLSLLGQFSSKWGNSALGTLKSVLEVQVPADISRKTSDYKRRTGNVRRRFHGTSCSPRCSFFSDPNGRPCGGKECNVCSICTHGFLLKGTGGLFGKGLYFSSDPDKADAYASSSQKTGSDGKRLRCMFVAAVSAGKPFVTNQGSLPQDQCPPPNYDSVVKDVGSGLGHDELVVYNEDAALPTHLIVYSLP